MGGPAQDSVRENAEAFLGAPPEKAGIEAGWAALRRFFKKESDGYEART